MFITFKVLVGKNMWNYPRHYFNDASQLLFPFYEGVFPCIVLLCSTVILPCGRQVGVPAPRRCPQLSVKKNQVTYGATSARHATNPVKAPSVHGAQEHIWEDCLQSPSGNYFSLITGVKIDWVLPHGIIKSKADPQRSPTPTSLWVSCQQPNLQPPAAQWPTPSVASPAIAAPGTKKFFLTSRLPVIPSLSFWFRPHKMPRQTEDTHTIFWSLLGQLVSWWFC